MDLAHPLGVTAGQIVVDGDHMDAFARQGVEVGGQNGHQGFTFTGAHFGNAALMQHDAADDLNPVGTHTQHAVRSLPDRGEGLGQQVVQGLALVQPLPELHGLMLQLARRSAAGILPPGP